MIKVRVQILCKGPGKTEYGMTYFDWKHFHAEIDVKADTAREAADIVAGRLQKLLGDGP